MTYISVEQRLAAAIPLILGYFESEDRRVFSKRDLQTIFRDEGTNWGLSGVGFSGFLETVLATEQLRQEQLKSQNYKSVTRFAWGEVSPYELAQSVRPKAYFSHASAVFLQGLNDQIPNTLYLNLEQSPKPRPSGGLTQARLDFAFRRAQRKSRYVFTHDQSQIVLLSGKHTDQLGVEEMPFGPKSTIRVAGAERTLIDIVVRPDYSGGATQILEAYHGARDLIAVPALYEMLAQLDYVYPYHQAIGYLLEKAGWGTEELKPFRESGLNLDFYLVPGMRDPEYVESWRLFVPQGFETG